MPDELRLDVGSVPTGMIPLEGKPMMEHLVDAYAEFQLDRVVAVGERSDSIRKHISRSGHDWKVVDASSSSSLGETILITLNAFDADDLRGQTLYLNFADTLISPIHRADSKSVVSYQTRDRPYRWTTFNIESERITNPIGRGIYNDSGRKPCFAGQFGLSDAKAFRQILREIPKQNDTKLDYFYRGLLSYLGTTDYKLYEPDSWIDVGHLDTYHRAKKRFLNAREFNELESYGKNVITKRSKDTETLTNEITWYLNIPKELQPYLPRIYDYSTDPEDTYVKMEYIGYPSLSDLQLHGSHGQHIWNDIFHHLFNIYREFQSFTADDEPIRIKNALEEMYVQKTRRRLDRLRNDDRFTPFFKADSVQVNGTDYPSVNKILKSLDEVAAEYNLLDYESLSIIHGDLCLPNILYDPRNEILKLIDPRGKFGDFDIYGDPRYDLAKLRHSLVGHYEHLINDQFEADVNLGDAELSYEIHTTEEQVEREARFDSMLVSQINTDIQEIKLIEALLFLSMVPLHSDSYERQLSMLSQGIEKFAPYIA
ncbi:hypothetical protein NDI54_06260 [Haloarcula sp. S1AR25-5A]|uniref:Aminoglycoside phosphotransferase domain-containing protein n=1 Tax=Haloarcula terrestris TaxID=2950533 RepID=A0AAE4EYB2_9EURY|nr:phosphotransferase [Haloarcula terrestris]MDS0220948.1 hypothetical protein [Haloarcula terrestris]